MPRTRTTLSALRIAACVVAVSLSASALRAQEDAPAEIAATPKPDDNLGVFVRDSAVAADKLALAQRMEKAQQWDTSAEVYQEVLDGFSDRVVPTHFDSQGRADRYGGVTSVIQDRIAAWPDAGREVYVTRYGAPAAKLLEAASADDRIALTRIADRYFVTDAGRDAALRLIEIHFEAGEFAAAASLADRLLDHHPAISEADRPLLLLRSTLAWRLAGEPNRAKPRAEALATNYAQAHAVLGGQDRLIAEVAANDATQTPDPSANIAHAETSGWHMPFGSADHAAVAAEPEAPARGQPPREWGKLLSFELDQGRPAGAAPDGEAELASLNSLIKRQRDLGSSTGILPSIDGSQLFFQDNARIYARDLATGAPLPGWLASYPNDAGAFKIQANFAPRGAQMTVSLTDQYVVAILGQGDGMNAQMFGEAPAEPGAVGRVVCLDRTTGKQVWAHNMGDAASAKAALDAQAKRANPNAPTDAKPPAATPPPPGRRVRGRVAPNAIPGVNGPALAGDESLRQTEPRGSALVVGDSVYVVARGGEPGAFEDCYLVAFSLTTGDFRWARHLASGNARMAFNGMPQMTGNADSHLACVDGRIYVSTDMGAIAAVDAVDGSLAWLALYPRPRASAQQPWMNQNMNAMRVHPAFEGNPVIVRDGKVLTMPADAEHLFVHDAATGEEIARVPTKWHLTDGGSFLAPAAGGKGSNERVDGVDVLAGLAGDRVVLASPQAISTLDWTKLRAGNNNANNASTELAAKDVVLHREEIRKPGFEDVAIRGRPFVTDRSIYVPTAWALFRLDLETGVALERYPTNDDWQNRADESAGNVLVVNGNVIVAGPERVSVYAGLSLVRQRLDAAIAAAPDAVAPRLRYAEAMANSNHNDESLHWIEQAAAKLPADRPADDADRAALFTTCVGLVRDLNRSGRTPDAPFQAKLLTQLAAVAATPTQQVTARLLRGGLAAQAKDYPTAVAAYESLIEEPAWATLHVKVGDDTKTISSVASDALKVLLATDAGRAAYSDVEARAAAELEKAKTANDPLAIFAIAERFPNSVAATDALRFSSEMLSRGEPGARPQLAISALRKLSTGVTDPAARTALDDAMLRSYLAAGDLPAALGRARRLAWTDVHYALNDLPAVKPALAAVTAGDLVPELQQILFDRAEAGLPDLKANLDGDSFDVSKLRVVNRIASLLPPQTFETSRPDRVVTIAQDRSLKIFEPGASEPLKTIRVPNVTDRTEITWLANERLLLRQPTRVACVDVNGATLAWSFDPSSLPAADGNAAVASITIDDAGLLALSPHPAVAGPVTPPSPEEQQFEQLVQQGNMDPALAARLLRNRRAAQQQQVMRNRAVINVNAAANGDTEADPRADDNAKESAIDALPVASGSLIAVATSHGQVIALDAATGTVKWRLPLGDRAPSTFRVVGDLIVFATTDESASHVIVVDAINGTETLRRSYSSAPLTRVCNVGVSDEGWLTVITANSIQLFDLIAGGREPLANVTINQEAAIAPFSNSRAPDHVQFCGDKLLVLADVVPPGTQGAPAVRSYDLPQLTPTRAGGAKNPKGVERRFLPRFYKDQRTGTERIELQVHKDRLYVMTGQFMTSYPVFEDDPADSAWTRVLPDQPSALSLQSPMLVKDGVLVIGWPNDFVNQTAPAARAELYSRQTYDGKHESGMCVEDAELTKRGGKIADRFQPVNGGLYYTTTDGSLVFVPGKPKPTDAK